ncbi:MAG: two-component system, NarL family, sensor histidine kinase EvgS [Actinomycetota bacterium]
MMSCDAHGVDRVLYIEDSMINTKLMDRVFAKLLPDVQLVTAPDGESGLVMLAETDPAVVLLDCHLPGMSGFEVLQTARSAGNPVPVVVVTADASPELEARMIAAGAEEFLTKPFEFSALVELVTKHLPDHSQEASSAAGVEHA